MNRFLYVLSWALVLFIVFVSGHAIFFGNTTQQLVGAAIWISFELVWLFGPFGRATWNKKDKTDE